MKNIIAFFIVLFVSASSFAIDNRYHINSRVELDQKPGTLLEIGEVISSQSALYFGALLPSDSKSDFEDEITMNKASIMVLYSLIQKRHLVLKRLRS